MDSAWWDYHRADVLKTFQGERFSHGFRAGVQRVRHPYYVLQGQNSGAGAIALAHKFGARRVILLGYDCCYHGKRRHWHGDHPEGGGSGNAGSVERWPGQFAELARLVRGMDIINCSRRTALTVFRRAKLEEALHGEPGQAREREVYGLPERGLSGMPGMSAA